MSPLNIMRGNCKEGLFKKNYCLFFIPFLEGEFLTFLGDETRYKLMDGIYRLNSLNYVSRTCRDKFDHLFILAKIISKKNANKFCFNIKKRTRNGKKFLGIRV